MQINPKTAEIYAETAPSFSSVASLAERDGHVVVYQHNQPKFLVIDLDKEPQIEMSEDEKFEFVTARILREHKAAFEELAKW